MTPFLRDLALALATVSVLVSLPAAIVLHRDARRSWWSLAHRDPGANGRGVVARAALRSSRWRIAEAAAFALTTGGLLAVIVTRGGRGEPPSTAGALLLLGFAVCSFLPAVDGVLAARERREILAAHRHTDDETAAHLEEDARP